MAHDVKVSTRDDDGGQLYARSTFSFEPGVTVLVGCNGSGKTTLMRRIEDKYKWGRSQEVSAKVFNCCDTGSEIGRLIGLAPTMDSISLGATMLSSSEGERMAQALKGAFDWMWGECRKVDVEEIFMMLDSLDSGMDIPTLRMVRGVLDDVVGIARSDFGKELYVLVSANSYALIEGRECLDVSTTRIISFGNWDDYAAFCERSHEKKDRRYEMEAAENHE